jgi:hypothetical protein
MSAPPARGHCAAGGDVLQSAGRLIIELIEARVQPLDAGVQGVFRCQSKGQIQVD